VYNKRVESENLNLVQEGRVKGNIRVGKLAVWVFVLGIFLVLSLGITVFLVYQGVRHALPTSNSKCSPTTIADYEVATIIESVDSTGIVITKPAQFQASLKGDNSMQTIIIYAQIANYGMRELPVITKIFSGQKNCLTEEFSYTGGGDGRSGNELHTAKVIPNFWGDGRTVLNVENESTGYGSASAYFLNFIVYVNGSFQIIKGPDVGSDILYTYRGTDGIGKEILVANPVWAETEAHFDPHIYKFKKFVWDGQGYISFKLGTTVNKYQGSIDKIIQAEPSVLWIENKLDLTSSTKTNRTNWERFTDLSYQMTVNYPESWSAISLPKNYADAPTFELSSGTTYASAPTNKKKIWLRVGHYQQFSTAWGVCYNRICDDVGNAIVTIKGKQYSTQIVRASSNKDGDPEQNVLGYYAFQFKLTDVGYPLSTFSQLYYPAITAYFYTPDEGQIIVDIISTITY